MCDVIICSGANSIGNSACNSSTTSGDLSENENHNVANHMPQSSPKMSLSSSPSRQHPHQLAMPLQPQRMAMMYDMLDPLTLNGAPVAVPTVRSLPRSFEPAKHGIFASTSERAQPRMPLRATSRPNNRVAPSGLLSIRQKPNDEGSRSTSAFVGVIGHDVRFPGSVC